MAARAPLVRLEGGGRLADARARRRDARRRAAGASRSPPSRRASRPGRTRSTSCCSACAPAGDGWTADRLDDVDGATVYDAFADPEAAAVIRGCSPRARRSRASTADRRILLGRGLRPPAARRAPCARWAPSSPTARSCSTTRSCSRLFRRLEAGENPELEMLRFLTEPRLPEHRRARRLDRLLGRADGRDARRRPALRRGRPRRLGARARRDRHRPGGVRRADGPSSAP